MGAWFESVCYLELCWIVWEWLTFWRLLWSCSKVTLHLFWNEAKAFAYCSSLVPICFLFVDCYFLLVAFYSLHFPHYFLIITIRCNYASDALISFNMVLLFCVAMMMMMMMMMMMRNYFLFIHCAYYINFFQLKF